MNDILPIGYRPTLQKGILSCFLIFIMATFFSFLYSSWTGLYNGDFGGVQVALDFTQLTLALFLTLFPYFLLFLFYCFFKCLPRYSGANILTSRNVAIFFAVFVIWFLFVTFYFGIGIMGQSSSDIPGTFSTLVKILNRVNPFYLGVLFILTFNGSKKIFFILISAFIVLGVSRAGIGVFLYISLALIVRYNFDIRSLFIRHKLKSLLLLVIFPLFVESLYELRSISRGEYSVNSLPIFELLFIKLIGRFSSFPNLAMILQESNYFIKNIPLLEDDYFLLHGAASILGVSIIPDVIPERLLINIFGGDLFNKSYMVGLSGNLYISYLKSPMIVWFNIFFVLGNMFATYIFCRKLNFEYSNEYATLLLIYPMTSGSALELSTLTISVMFFYLLFRLVNLVFQLRLFRYYASKK